MKINSLPISPKDLDKQSPVKIDRWLDLNSEECYAKDPDIALTKKWLKIGAEEGFLMVDSNGRIWGKGKSNNFFPYHFNVGSTNYGFRLSMKAAN